MSIRFFNTMTRALEDFRPLNPGEVRLYTCGPTVHNFAHIGNFRTYVFEDLLRRYLRFRGYRVLQVMNITDVEDKIIRRTVAEGRSLQDVTAPYIEAFFQDLDRLNIERAEHYPRATQHVDGMVAMIRTLLERGLAYRSEDGSIYYDISKFPAYGSLAHIQVEALQAGARVAQDEYDKERAADFALWKAWDPSDGEVFWDRYPDLGKGRPGWHIECSAMSIQYLGEHFDLHTGGVDNIFPHHQNEIAQAEPCTGQTFVNYWLHSEHLQVDSRKMSKSEGNFFTLRDLLAADRNPSGQAWDPMAVRYLLSATHYRSRVDFTFKALRAAGDTRQGLLEFLRRCLRQPGAGPVDPEVAEELQQARQAFVEALDEDLNTPEALAVLHTLRHEINRRIDETGGLGAASGRAVVDLVLELDRVLGLRLDEALAQPELLAEELALIEERQVARRTRDFARADGLRQELEGRGIRLEDTPQGVTWKIDPSRR